MDKNLLLNGLKKNFTINVCPVFLKLGLQVFTKYNMGLIRDFFFKLVQCGRWQGTGISLSSIQEKKKKTGQFPFLFTRWSSCLRGRIICKKKNTRKPLKKSASSFMYINIVYTSSHGNTLCHHSFMVFSFVFLHPTRGTRVSGLLPKREGPPSLVSD